MLNYFNFEYKNDTFLITNDYGYYCYLTKIQFKQFVSEKIDISSNKGKELIEKGFLINGSVEKHIQMNQYLINKMKSYLYTAPSLHIFVVTTACNADCIYCQAHSLKTKKALFMSKETAEKAVDIALSSPDQNLSFEFQGGEPLLNFDTIKHIINYTNIHKHEKKVSFNLVSNITLITSQMIDFFKENNVSISTSVDGNKEIHDHNRPYKDRNKGTFDCVKEKIEILKNSNLNLGAIQTTTNYSLDKYNLIIDQYLSFGFNSIFIRPLTPLGIASEKWSEVGYSAQEFILFYRKCLQRIIKINKSGTLFIEGHAKIFLNKILLNSSINYMELRSPCGGGLGQVAYYPNGNIFTCDEGRMLSEMGNNSFKMGNIFDSNYTDLIKSSACKVVCKTSILESLPSCSTCVYQPYCGICPVINYASLNDVIEKSPSNYRCKIYKGILDTIFDFLKDKETERIFFSWIS